MNEKGPSRIRRRKRVRGKIEEQREKGKRESEGESVNERMWRRREKEG